MQAIKFYDENTRNWWYPETGGSNVPALNGLLAPWGISFSNEVYDGTFPAMMDGGKPVDYASGSTLLTFPAGGIVVSAVLKNQGAEVQKQTPRQELVPVLGFHQVGGQWNQASCRKVLSGRWWDVGKRDATT